MSLLIFEGVTGSGKTSTLQALRRICAFEVISEEDTFGNFIAEFDRDPHAAAVRSAQRLNGILDDVAQRADENIVLERFHFSSIAVGADPGLFGEVAERCGELGCTVVVFTLPDEALARRSLYRAEYDGDDWQRLCSAYGSEEAALQVLGRSQAARLSAIRSGGLTYREIDTETMAWDRYAAEISDLAKWHRAE